MAIGTVITPAGRELINMAVASGQPLALNKAGLGSGVWAEGVARETLKSQKAEVLVQQISGQNPLQPLLRIIIPPDVGGFKLSEIAVYTPEGAVFAITEYPVTDLPVPGTSPVLVEQVIDLVLPVGEPNVVKMVVDPSVTATQSYVIAENKFLAGSIVRQLNESQDEQSQALSNEIDQKIEKSAYEHPASHPAQMIETDAARQFVTDDQINSWNSRIEESAFGGVVNRLQSVELMLKGVTDKSLDTLPEIVAKIKQIGADLESKSPSWGIITNKPLTATRWPTYSEVTGKPAVYPPSDHNHDTSYAAKAHSHSGYAPVNYSNITAIGGRSAV